MNGFPPDHDCFSDTDCPEVKSFPTAAVVIGCIVLAAFLAAVCAAWRAWA